MKAMRLLPVPVFAGCLLALGRVGGDDLGVPFGTVDDLAAWVDATEPAALAMAVLRLVAQLLCAYLLLAAVLQLSADVLGYPWLTVLARRAVPFAVRHALSGGAGLGLAAGSVLGSAGGVAGASPGPARVFVTTTDDAAPTATPTATMTLLVPTPPAGTPATTPTTSASTPTATMVLLPSAPAGDTGAPTPDDAAGSAVSLEPAPVPVADTDDGNSTDGTPATSNPPPTTLVVTVPSPEAPSTSAVGLPTTTSSTPAGAEPSAVTVDDNEVWVVDAGDSFWSIAEDVVGLGRRTQAYWEQLIAANRDRLAVPDQPDLLFPGQRLTLPPPVPREG